MGESFGISASSPICAAPSSIAIMCSKSSWFFSALQETARPPLNVMEKFSIKLPW